jgi:two-component sensor histidine kinase
MIKMRTDNQEAIDLLTDARPKIYTMSLVHTQLYEEKRFDQIDMKSHIRQLVNHLSQVYSGRGRSVSPTIQPCDVLLTVEQAIPCALVLNELVSNVFKHAFREAEQGTMEVSIQNSDHDTVTIRVKDDGVGIPEQLDIDKTQTLGLKLAKNLVESQLKGQIRVNRDSGTEVIVEFKAQEEEVQHEKHA